jgi:hypothetical protein
MEDIKNIVNSYTDIWTDNVIENMNNMIENSYIFKADEKIKEIKTIIENVLTNPDKYYEDYGKITRTQDFNIKYYYKGVTVGDSVGSSAGTFIEIAIFNTPKNMMYKNRIMNYFNKFKNIQFSINKNNHDLIIGMIKLSENNNNNR